MSVAARDAVKQVMAESYAGTLIPRIAASLAQPSEFATARDRETGVRRRKIAASDSLSCIEVKSRFMRVF